MDYTDRITCHVLVARIYDAEIHRDNLDVEGIIDRPVNEVISLVEKGEMTCDTKMVSGNT